MRVRVIIWRVQTHAQHVHRKQTVQFVIQKETHVRHAKMGIIQVDQGVRHVCQNIVRSVERVMASVLNVRRDTICQVDRV